MKDLFGWADSWNACQPKTQFDGNTFDEPRDGDRLRIQLWKTRHVMSDGRWRTLAELAAEVGAPEPSVSARLRDLRKSKFGSLTIDREYVRDGLWKYRWNRGAP